MFTYYTVMYFSVGFASLERDARRVTSVFRFLTLLFAQVSIGKCAFLLAFLLLKKKIIANQI
jgi:hypothetical protein